MILLVTIITNDLVSVFTQQRFFMTKNARKACDEAASFLRSLFDAKEAN
jgi:hypothetical protein